MSTSVSRRSVALLASAAVSLSAALAIAPAAGATSYYACVTKGGTTHIFTKKPKCKKGESKLAWNNVGPAGKNGTNGANGSNGTNGSNGSNGTKGENGTPGGFFGVLPSGKTMRGTYAAEGNVAGQQYRTGVSFLLSLPSTPAIHFVQTGEAPPTGCTGGTAAAPVAAAGNLCIFEGVSIGNSTNRGEVNPINDEAPNVSMPLFGFGVYSSCTTTPCVDEGSWAVTAP